MQLKKDRTSKGGKVGDIKTLTQQTKRRLLLRCQCLTAFTSTTHFQKKPLKEWQGLGKGVKGISPYKRQRHPKKGSLSVLAVLTN